MKKIKTKNVKQEYISQITCDVCGCEIDIDHGAAHINIKQQFGYFSEYFQDHDEIDIDICEFIKERSLDYLITNAYLDAHPYKQVSKKSSHGRI